MRILDRVLARTRNHYLYDAVVQQLFVQIFYFSSCHLVNIILQKAKLTPSIGFQIKLGYVLQLREKGEGDNQRMLFRL